MLKKQHTQPESHEIVQAIIDLIQTGAIKIDRSPRSTENHAKAISKAREQQAKEAENLERWENESYRSIKADSEEILSSVHRYMLASSKYKGYQHDRATAAIIEDVAQFQFSPQGIIALLMKNTLMAFARYLKLKDPDGFGMTGNSGATVVFSLIYQQKVYIAHLGDSRALLGSQQSDGNYTFERLTWDHVASDPEEKARIKVAGGFVPANTMNQFVRKGCLAGRLQVSRALGDTSLFEGKEQPLRGLSIEPDIRIIDVSNLTNPVLLLGSDGVFAADGVHETHVAKMLNAQLTSQSSINMHALVKQIGDQAEAWGTGQGDNKNVIGAALGQLSPDQAIALASLDGHGSDRKTGHVVAEMASEVLPQLLQAFVRNHALVLSSSQTVTDNNDNSATSTSSPSGTPTANYSLKGLQPYLWARMPVNFDLIQKHLWILVNADAYANFRHVTLDSQATHVLASSENRATLKIDTDGWKIFNQDTNSWGSTKQNLNEVLERLGIQWQSVLTPTENLKIPSQHIDHYKAEIMPYLWPQVPSNRGHIQAGFWFWVDINTYKRSFPNHKTDASVTHLLVGAKHTVGLKIDTNGFSLYDFNKKSFDPPIQTLEAVYKALTFPPENILQPATNAMIPQKFLEETQPQTKNENNNATSEAANPRNGISVQLRHLEELIQQHSIVKVKELLSDVIVAFDFDLTIIKDFTGAGSIMFDGNARIDQAIRRIEANPDVTQAQIDNELKSHIRNYEELKAFLALLKQLEVPVAVATQSFNGKRIKQVFELLGYPLPEDKDYLLQGFMTKGSTIIQNKEVPINFFDIVATHREAVQKVQRGETLQGDYWPYINESSDPSASTNYYQLPDQAPAYYEALKQAKVREQGKNPHLGALLHLYNQAHPNKQKRCIVFMDDSAENCDRFKQFKGFLQEMQNHDASINFGVDPNEVEVCSLEARLPNNWDQDQPTYLGAALNYINAHAEKKLQQQQVQSTAGERTPPLQRNDSSYILPVDDFLKPQQNANKSHLSQQRQETTTTTTTTTTTASNTAANTGEPLNNPTPAASFNDVERDEIVTALNVILSKGQQNPIGFVHYVNEDDGKDESRITKKVHIRTDLVKDIPDDIEAIEILNEMQKNGEIELLREEHPYQVQLAITGVNYALVLRRATEVKASPQSAVQQPQTIFFANQPQPDFSFQGLPWQRALTSSTEVTKEQVRNVILNSIFNNWPADAVVAKLQWLEACYQAIKNSMDYPSRSRSNSWFSRKQSEDTEKLSSLKIDHISVLKDLYKQIVKDMPRDLEEGKKQAILAQIQKSDDNNNPKLIDFNTSKYFAKENTDTRKAVQAIFVEKGWIEASRSRSPSSAEQGVCLP